MEKKILTKKQLEMKTLGVVRVVFYSLFVLICVALSIAILISGIVIKQNQVLFTIIEAIIVLCIGIYPFYNICRSFKNKKIVTEGRFCIIEDKITSSYSFDEREMVDTEIYTNLIGEKIYLSEKEKKKIYIVYEKDKVKNMLGVFRPEQYELDDELKKYIITIPKMVDVQPLPDYKLYIVLETGDYYIYDIHKKINKINEFEILINTEGLFEKVYIGDKGYSLKWSSEDCNTDEPYVLEYQELITEENRR